MAATEQPSRRRAARALGLGTACLAVALGLVVGAAWLLRGETVYVFAQGKSMPAAAPDEASAGPAPGLHQNVEAPVPLPPLPVDLSTPTADADALPDLPFDAEAAIQRLREAK